MALPQDPVYYKGYLMGYLDGVRDTLHGTATETTANSLKNLPIQAMELSTRARNCLTRAGCVTIGDVTNLSEAKLSVMRNLGIKTAAEIAHWLDDHGFRHSAWSKYW